MFDKYRPLRKRLVDDLVPSQLPQNSGLNRTCHWFGPVANDPQAKMNDGSAPKGLLQDIVDSHDGKERAELFKKVKTNLTAHSRSEEKVLYRRLEKSKDGKDEALEGFVEHEMADYLVEGLARARDKESDQWKARCTVLKEMLEHHIGEEESEVFRTAESLFDGQQLEAMGEEFAKEKAKHGVKETVDE